MCSLTPTSYPHLKLVGMYGKDLAARYRLGNLLPRLDSNNQLEQSREKRSGNPAPGYCSYNKKELPDPIT